MVAITAVLNLVPEVRHSHVFFAIGLSNPLLQARPSRTSPYL
jgi:hypothetical protein